MGSGPEIICAFDLLGEWIVKHMCWICLKGPEVSYISVPLVHWCRACCRGYNPAALACCRIYRSESCHLRRL